MQNDIVTIARASSSEERMSSLDLAKLVGRKHSHLMRDIRNMEKGWKEVSQSTFGLSSYLQPQPNGGHKEVACYSLTKLETLYIASKFKDKERAKLVLRWEQLEREKQEQLQAQIPQSFSQALLLAAKQQEQIEAQQKQIAEQQGEILQLSSTVQSMEKKVTYLDRILACPSTVKVKTIAQDYGMSAIAFNQLLHELGIQYRCGKVWVLYAKYLSEGYVKDVPFTFTHKDGSEGVSSNTQWTQKGRMFLYHFLKERGILPLIERPQQKELAFD